MLPALISASVTFAALAISQWIISQREQSQLLLGKLEDLYYHLLDLGKQNMSRFDPITRLALGDLVQGSEFPSLDEIMLADLLERIRLLIEFYFPELREDLEAVYEANRACVGLLTQSELHPNYKEIQSIGADFADKKAVIERRILSERLVLTKAFGQGLGKWWTKMTSG